MLLELCRSTSTSFIFPCSLAIICNFISHLHSQSLSPSTILPHVSAISYVHKICNVTDPTQQFLVRKILKGAQNLKKSSDSRLPITKPILLRILAALQHTVSDKNGIILLRAIFLLAFHGFFRLGELVSRIKESFHLVFQRNDINFQPNHGVQIILKHYKTMRNNQPITIMLTPSADLSICQVQALRLYITAFGHTSGPLFSFLSGHPVTHSFVTQQLKLALAFCDLNPAQYKGHSFRIGAATEAAKLGYSENYIQQLGRWHSNAIKRYIRINSFSL